MGGQHGINSEDRNSVDGHKNVYHVTGSLNPDVTGNYIYKGIWNGKPFYKLNTSNYFLSWTVSSKWVLSLSPGLEVGPRWQRIDPDIEGDYQPQLPATGVATVIHGRG